MKKPFIAVSIVIAAICVFLIIVLAAGFWQRFFPSRNQEQSRTRLVIPRELSVTETDSGMAEQLAWDDSFYTKLALDEGEIVISVLNQDLGEDQPGEQIVAYRSLAEMESPVYITCISYDEKSGVYKRMWNASCAATQSGTISLYAQDLIGDRNNCILVTGLNSRGEHTLTVFRRNPNLAPNQAFVKIAELKIDGSIVVQETGRSQAYHLGIANGESFPILAYSQDSGSGNILDQLETTYVYNPAKGQYEQSKIARIPGSQVEQRRLRELLSGAPGVFEEFINGLWYYISPQGTLDTRQYLYFDPQSREIIFFGDETQQIFSWQQSTPTRYGIYVRSQNISISTLRRFLDIELESLESIRLRVSEDVRLKIIVSASWDGSYRRAEAHLVKEKEPSIKPGIDALYDSSWGRLHFLPSGEYTLSSGGVVRSGRYVFFKINNQNLLELRPEPGSEFRTSERADAPVETRMTFRADSAGNAISLSRVRLSAWGIQDLLEGQVLLTPVE